MMVNDIDLMAVYNNVINKQPLYFVNDLIVINENEFEVNEIKVDGLDHLDVFLKYQETEQDIENIFTYFLAMIGICRAIRTDCFYLNDWVYYKHGSPLYNKQTFKGYPDLKINIKGLRHDFLYVEVKRPGGKLSKCQSAVHEFLDSCADIMVCVVCTFFDFISLLGYYLFDEEDVFFDDRIIHAMYICDAYRRNSLYLDSGMNYVIKQHLSVGTGLMPNQYEYRKLITYPELKPATLFA